MSDVIAPSRRRTLRHRRWRTVGPLITVYLPILPYILFALFPLYFMVVTSLKSNAELYDVSTVPFWIARGPTMGHYALLSEDTPFWDWFANSLIVSLSATAISVALGVLAAYPLARIRFPGADSFGVAVFPGNGTAPADLLKAADNALYRAKREGRDRVCVAESSADTPQAT